MNIFYPIELLADFLTYQLLDIKNIYLGNAINFFIYDLIKIGILLIFINYIMAIVRYYLPLEKIRDILNKKNYFKYLISALLGMITPFCSCSSIPLFIGFIGAGIPLGVTFTFLIASPLINESSLFLFPSIFGWKITIIYNILGIIIAVLGGMLIEKLHLEKYIKKEFLQFKSRKEIETENGNMSLPFKKLIKYFWNDGFSITKSIFPYLVLGVGVGALIHGFIPISLVEKYLSLKDWWVVPFSVLLGSPLYANSVSVIPIMEALVNKGIPLGTVLAFMTAIVTISLPEIMILKKVMHIKLLAIFLSISIVGIIIMGYLFNFIF